MDFPTDRYKLRMTFMYKFEPIRAQDTTHLEAAYCGLTGAFTQFDLIQN